MPLAFPNVLRDAEELLCEHGWKDTRVHRVYSPGDTGGEFEAILFVTHGGEARTAFVVVDADRRVQRLRVIEGW